MRWLDIQRGTAIRGCEHAFVTSQGSPYTRFRHALLTKNMTIIDAAAAELGRLELDDALRVLVVMAEKHDPRFGRAAARFAARVTLERRLGRADAYRVLALAESLPQAPEVVAQVLRPFTSSASRRGTGA